MSAWFWSGRTAILVGGVSFLILWLPMLVLQYRRWGAWNLARTLGSLAVSLYGSALVTYTLLPLPDPATLNCGTGLRVPQLTPLRLVGDIRAVWEARGSLTGTLRSFTFQQVAFNVLLFVPWGIIVRRFLRRGFFFTVITGFLVSLFIEVTQGTGLWGIYPCAYRLADVDDLITNTTGALLGALLAPLVLWWMPDAATLATKRLQPRPVTAVRRWLGQLLDVAALTLVAGTLHLVAVVVVLLAGWAPNSTPALVAQSVAEVVAWLVVFLVPAWNHLGASFGQAAVWLTPMWTNRHGVRSHGPRWLRLLRANIVALPCLIWTLWSLWGPAPLPDLVWLMPLVAAILLVPFTRTRRSLSGWLTRAEFVDIRTLDDIAVRKDRGGFRQENQDSTATSNVSGTVTKANPNP
ncbi:MAG: VanZ family protein [Propionibacteriaceae bacterium]|nr:VanZ family protein [Propionibacteriaceae bacterium]